uniref:Apple domain-containing protein n=1 Tax=Clytia hemisphaerica TaxID=252671 RepID=A0A7M5URX9_9CNID
MMIFCSIFIYWMLLLSTTCAQHQQIRRFSQISGKNVFYGYANMVAHQDHILNVTALQTITINTTSPAKCITNCIDVENCNSVNVIIEQNGDLECQLLDTDRFRNSSSFIPQTESTHYAIK